MYLKVPETSFAEWVQWLLFHFSVFHNITDKIVDVYTVKSLYIISEGTAKNIWWMYENSSCRKVIYMGDVQGPEKVNDAWVKTVHARTMDRGFIVILNLDLVTAASKMPEPTFCDRYSMCASLVTLQASSECILTVSMRS
jgi:hypothetical protein